MDKLTWYDEDGRLYCRRGYEVALARLASYEATELMPDEIVKMGMMFEDSKRYSGRLELKLNAATKRMPKWVSVKERLPEDRSNVLVVAYWHERWGVYMGWCAPERAKWSVHVGTISQFTQTVKPAGLRKEGGAPCLKLLMPLPRKRR